MKGTRYPEEFKIAAVKQVTDEGHAIPDVAKRLGVTTKSLYNWRARYGENAPNLLSQKSNDAELRRLKSELKRVTMERSVAATG